VLEREIPAPPSFFSVAAGAILLPADCRPISLRTLTFGGEVVASASNSIVRAVALYLTDHLIFLLLIEIT